MNVSLGCFGLALGDEIKIKTAGYDAAEFHVACIMEPDRSDFHEVQQRMIATGLDFSVWDNPIPLPVAICDDSFNLNFWKEYLLQACERCAQLGCKKYVFGNGKGRSLPESADVRAARGKLDNFVDLLCDTSQQFGITVMIEPLGAEFSNIFNTIGECAEAITYYGKSNMSSLVDLRHLVSQGLPMTEIIKHKELVSHVHIDYPYSIYPDRYFPHNSDDYDYTPFFTTLQEIDYKGIISIEANKFNNYSIALADGLSFLLSYVDRH